MALPAGLRGITAIRAHRDLLAGEARQILERSTGTLAEPDEGRFREIEADLDELRTLEQRWASIDTALAGRSVEDGDGAGNGGAPNVNTRTADPWADPLTAPGTPARPDDLRARALTVIERCERMPDAARQRITLDVDADDDPASGLARYVIEASQPAYRTAFAAWMRDPTAGPYT